jgi:hypothetical protein
MTAFYDQASLVVVPSGYKSGKIYAQKPLTTDGQLTFTRASTATRVNASGLIESVASGVPRLDYTNSSCPKLLLEPQRTNKQTQSENINATDYSSNTQITISSNAGTAPDGATTADKIVATAVSSDHAIKTSKATPNGYDIISCFVKASGYNYVQLTSWADPANYVNFDLTDGTLGTVSTATVYGIQSYGNGWYRIWANVRASGAGIVGIHIVTSKTAGWAQSFTGNGTDGLLVWGVQIEAATYPTSYIKTEAAAVTRLADNANKTSISGLIGQTEGTVYWEGTLNSFGAFPQIFDLHTLPDKFMQVYNSVVSGTPRIGVYIQNTTILFNSANLTAISYDTKLKLAFAYKANNYTLYLNGTQVWTNTSIASVPASASFSLGDSGTGASTSVKSVNQALIFKTRLTNAQLAELTTL